jgi:hypothetical protein
LTTFGGAADGDVADVEDEGEDGVLAGWFVWTEQARKRRLVVAALVAATIAV